MSYPSNSAMYGGVRLRPTASIESRCSREGIEVPIEEVIPAGIVKRLKEEREGHNTSTRETNASDTEDENGKVANLIKLTQQRAQLARSQSHKEIKTYLQSSSSVSSVDGDKYGITLKSYESTSVISSNPRTDEIIKASRNYVSSLPTGSMGSVRSAHGARKDKYGVVLKSSASVSTIPSSDNWKKSKTSPRDNIRASRSYASIVSNTTKGSAESARDGPPPLIFDSNIIDYADESILETELCKKFLNAFETTLQKNPGILPGDPLVIESLNNTLAKLMKENDNREEQMRKQIDNVKAENEEMESRLRDLRGSLTVKKIELTKELEKEKKDKEVSEGALKKLSEDNEAMKRDVNHRMDEATKEKEELTKHISILTKSRDEIKSSLETEIKLVEKDREALREVVNERKSIQKQKADNKELESQIEIMTEAASKKKAALQAEAADIKTFEDHLQQLRQSNDTIRKEVEDEKRELLEITLALQNKKKSILERKEELDIRMQKEKEELEDKVENSRMMNAKDMERLVQSKIVNYFKRGGSSEIEEDGICVDASVMDIESIIKSRVAIELKQKEIEMKERELERKEQMMMEKEVKERDVRKKELDEQLRKESERLEKITRRMKIRENELEERILREKREKGLRFNQVREKKTNKNLGDKYEKMGVNTVRKHNETVGIGDSDFDLNALVESRVVAELRKKESELEKSQSDLRFTRNPPSGENTEDCSECAASSMSTQERCNKSFHGERPFPKIYVSNDDERLGNETIVALNDSSRKNVTQTVSQLRIGGQSERIKQNHNECNTSEKNSKMTEIQEELLKLREELCNVRLRKERFEQMINDKNECTFQNMDEDSREQNDQEFDSLGNNLNVNVSSFDFQIDNIQSSRSGIVVSHENSGDKDVPSKALLGRTSSTALDFFPNRNPQNDDDAANMIHTRAYRCLLPSLTGLRQG